MAAVGGSIESIEINGRNFAVASDAEATRKLGGFEKEMAANGDGTARVMKTRVPWSLDGVTVEIDDDKGDQEFLQEIANGNGMVPVSITFASGITYSGSGTITGELGAGSQNATAGISLSGPGELGKQ